MSGTESRIETLNERLQAARPKTFTDPQQPLNPRPGSLGRKYQLLININLLLDSFKIKWGRVSYVKLCLMCYVLSRSLLCKKGNDWGSDGVKIYAFDSDECKNQLIL